MYGMFEYVERRLKENNLWSAMEQTVENSPYHREKNVAVHTQMVIQNYIKATNKEKEAWLIEDVMGAVAALFHDVGKPVAEEETSKKFLGITISSKRSYQNHEVMSANIFFDFALNELPEGFFTDEQLYLIHTMIVHHRPFVSKGKLAKIVTHMRHYGLTEQFIRLVESDGYGRTYDKDIEPKSHTKIKEWAELFSSMSNSDKHYYTPLPVRVILPVGVSGSGKSTLSASVDAEITSLDSLRMSLYDGDTVGYKEAFRLSESDPDFTMKSIQHFQELLKTDLMIFVDNLNVGKKYRRRYTENARQAKIGSRAVIFMTKLDTALARSAKRPNKHIPYNSVVMQWNMRSFPLYGEVDEIEFFRG